MAAVQEEDACSWCDEAAVIREPADRSGLFNQACRTHVPELIEDATEKPTAFIATPHGRRVLDMGELIAWGVADAKPRYKPATGTMESVVEARLRANKECADRFREHYGTDY